MIIKHLAAILLLAALLFSGAAAAEETSFTVNIYDNSAPHDSIRDAKVVMTNVTDVNDVQTRYTNVNGRAEFTRTYLSSYAISVSKDGYETYNISSHRIDTRNGDRTVYLQVSNLIRIKVQNPDGSTPVAGASVSIDSLNEGKTNSEGELHVPMNKGTSHSIQVTADSYETYTSSQYITTVQTSLTITLSKSYLSPRVLVYDTDKKPISAAAVIIDGTTTVYTDEYGRASFSRFTAGTYDLQVTKINYVPYSKRVTFSEDSSDVIVELAYETVPVTILVVDGANPIADALVSLDKLVTGVTDATGKFTKPMSPGQTVLFEASKDGYTGSSISYQITATGNNTVTLTLTPNFPTSIIVAGGIIAVVVIVILVVLFSRSKGGGKNNTGRKRSL